MDILIKCNVGHNERLIRFAVGAAAGIAAYLAPSKAAKAALGTAGFFGFATAASRFCPVNQLIGRDRCQPYNRSLRQLIRRI